MAEFVITQSSGHNKGTSKATVLSDGSFVVVWSSYGQDGSEWGVYGQRYGADGSKLSGEFQVNTYTNSEQYGPSITGLSNGNFVVVWHSYGQDGSGAGVYGQRYGADGSKLGGEFQVNTHTNSYQYYPSITGLSNGNFVVVWYSYGQDGSLYGVYGQRYGGDGSKLGGEFQVNTYTNSDQYGPSITGLSNGNFVVVWYSYGQDGSLYGVYGQRYEADGSKLGGEFQVNSYTTGNQNAPSITSLSNGNFVVAWGSEGQDGSGAGVYGQRYGADGSKLSGEFQVNSYTTGNQYHPSITSLSNGNFVVVWHSEGQEGGGPGVHAQVYDSEGNKMNNEFKVSTIAASETAPNVAKLKGNGGFIITYTQGDTIYATTMAAGTNGDDDLIAMHGESTTYGYYGYDTVSYLNVTKAVQIDLTEGSSYVEGIIGSAFDDIITGNRDANIIQGKAGDDIIDGRAGADDLDGGDGIDTVTYANSSAGVTVSLVPGVLGQGGDARGDLLLNIENLTGSRHADKLTGDHRDNVIAGLGGGDELDGGEGSDTLSYENYDKVVNIDLLNNGSTKPKRGADTFNNFENIIGSLKSDTLSGDNKPNTIYGSDGNDVIKGRGGGDRLDGGKGSNTLSYRDSSSGVKVDLTTGKCQGGDAEGDVISNFSDVIGTLYDDVLVGTDSKNNIHAGGGNDIVEGKGGGDKLDGGHGVDTLVYVSSKTGVSVDLELGHGFMTDDPDIRDDIRNFENVIGSQYDDELIGDHGDNVMEGGEGADDMYGGRGSDTVSYRNSNKGVRVNLSVIEQEMGDRLHDFENIIGSEYNDVLSGDKGDNLIESGGGDDILTGGKGRDVFKITNAKGVVRIKDFEYGDKLDLSEFKDIKSFNELKNKMSSTSYASGNPVIKLGGTEIFVEGVRSLYEENVLYHSNIGVDNGKDGSHVCAELIRELLKTFCLREEESLQKRSLSGKEVVVGSYCKDGLYQGMGHRVIKEDVNEYKYAVASVEEGKELVVIDTMNARVDRCMRDERKLWVDADMDNDIDVLVYTRRDGSSSICYCESIEDNVQISDDCTTLEELF
ncbi:calcium-binding protein [Rickettsiales endosymbiont of Peranema trichophorum]|uniref:calcium-binding protein n=1 Tax=Rickettsiales endosymbiont of Peranema trichophorum TaxID=2486577 RepID=UPI001022BC34|nr:calcium-binding protein [Rickettsiales endosymbiont of Peranema trichophorum]RZI47492.1 calcium-binding protein [Rickettsiales endosymbiont of Peranema trichophorum]